MKTWTQIAQDYWPNARRILGEGRFACANPDGTVVYLAMTEQQQKNIALGIEKPLMKDLKYLTPPVLNIKDDWEDREWERKRRANQ